MISVLVLMFSMPETRGLSLEDIQQTFLVPGTAQRGRVVSLLRRWVGVGGSDGSSPAGSSSGSTVELRDVGDLLGRGTDAGGVETASVQTASDRVVRV